eukprot:15440337-Alexandrium_andersonii.AAC.1
MCGLAVRVHGAPLQHAATVHCGSCVEVERDLRAIVPLICVGVASYLGSRAVSLIGHCQGRVSRSSILGVTLQVHVDAAVCKQLIRWVWHVWMRSCVRRRLSCVNVAGVCS